MIDDYITQWQGIPVKSYTPEEALECSDNIYRIAYSWDNEDAGELKDQFVKYIASSGSAESIGLSLGLNDESADSFYSEAVLPLLEQKDHFLKLRFLFLGEMVGEDSELTWIGQGDVGAPVLSAFPELEELGARGGLDYSEDGTGPLVFSVSEHQKLKKLVIQTGGLSREAFQGIIQSSFPELETLEIWLGSDERGATCSIDDIRSLLLGNPFPKLKSLGLMNSEIADEIAKEIADAPILDQLTDLSLSMGTLKDDGAKALLASEKVKSLKTLDLHHHYMSTEVMNQFASLGPKVNVSEQEAADEWDGEVHYYVAVSE